MSEFFLMGILLMDHMHKLRSRFFSIRGAKKCNTGEVHDRIFGAEERET